MAKIMLVVQYDGTDYAGFQWQPGLPTVQAKLQKALSAVLHEPVKVSGASRTDAGVHALGQVVTFTTEKPIPVANIVRAVNDHLPVAVNVASAQLVADSFHPRYDALRKLYSYRILNRQVGSPFISRYAWHIPEDLDIELMRAAGAIFVGQHDFAAFCAAGSSVEDTIRQIYRFDLEREDSTIRISVEGDGFLYKMVRLMVGTVLQVGLGRRAVDEEREILASRDSTQAGPTAPSCGLCLVRVDYEV